MLRLEITTQPALLGLSTRPPQVEVDYPRQMMRMASTSPSLDVSLEMPAVEIDTRIPKAELGLRPPLHFSSELASAGQQAVIEATRLWASEGDELARIEEGPKIVHLAAHRAWPGDRRQLNVDVAPKSRIELTVRGGVEIDLNPGELELEIEENPVSVVWHPGAVKSYLIQKEAIEIRVVGDRFSAVG